MGRRDYGGLGRALLVVLVVAGLLALVFVLASDRNRARYRLTIFGDELLVERGLAMPMGFGAYTPDDKGLAQAYARLPWPPAEAPPSFQVYEERSDLDRALFALLSGLAQPRMASADRDVFDLSRLYVERASLLPGLSEEQRKELTQMRAELSYQYGRRLLDEAADRLQKAREAFGQANKLGSPRVADAPQWLAETERRILATTPPPDFVPPKEAIAPIEQREPL